MVPHCHGAKLGSCLCEPRMPWRDGTLGLPAGSEMGHPKHSPACSLEHTAHTSHPVVILHCYFVGYLFSCQQCFLCYPIQPNGFKFKFSLRVMQINTLTLSEKILLYSQFSQMPLLGVSKRKSV